MTHERPKPKMTAEPRPRDSAHPRGIVPPYVFENMERHKRLSDIAAGLAALAAKKALDESQSAMLSEGAPLYDKEQGEEND